MSTDEKFEIVRSRINLVKSLIENRELFRGEHLTEYRPNSGIHPYRYNEMFHSYRHYTALWNYLALTCFDIIGQPADWVAYPTWLESKEKKEEREAIFAAHSDKEFCKALKAVFNDYNTIYGVRNSFNRFLREIISPENRKKLMDSIQVRKAVHEASNPETQENQYVILHEEHLKEKFLFTIRNSFTHKGASPGDETGQIIDRFTPRFHDEAGNPEWPFLYIFSERINKSLYVYNVRNWPLILIEIIEETMRENLQ